MDFFATYETARYSDGFPLLGTAHRLWLAGGTAVLLVLVLRYRSAHAKKRQRILRILAVSMLLLEVLKQTLLLRLGVYTAAYLPMHLCSLGMLAAASFAAHPSADAGEFLFAAVLPGTAAALVFPGWSSLPVNSFLSLHSFLYHFLLLGAVMLPLSAGEIHPDPRRLPDVCRTLFFLSAEAYVLNRVCGTNFFFLADPGRDNPLAAAARHFGETGYLLLFPLLAALLWLLLYGASAILPQGNGAAASRSGHVDQPLIRGTAEAQGNIVQCLHVPSVHEDIEKIEDLCGHLTARMRAWRCQLLVRKAGKRPHGFLRVGFPHTAKKRKKCALIRRLKRLAAEDSESADIGR